MYIESTTVVNPSGLHARPAAEFVKTSSKFKSDVKLRITGDDKEANAKSIVFVLSLGLSKGTQIDIIADGEDEKEAVTTLVELINSGFGEL